MADETNDQNELLPPSLRKPPTAAEMIETQPDASFKDAYKTRCPGCPSTLMVALPMVHCPACHYIWRAKKLTGPSRCARCEFSLWKWRLANRIKDFGAENALRA